VPSAKAATVAEGVETAAPTSACAAGLATETVTADEAGRTRGGFMPAAIGLAANGLAEGAGAASRSGDAVRRLGGRDCESDWVGETSELRLFMNP
jgi:hypothetical protein